MKTVKNILVAGGGMMGKNIAFVFASCEDLRIGVYDMYDVDVAGGIRKNAAALVEKGVLSEKELEARLSRIEFSKDIDSDLVKRADLVVEAVFEDMDVKRETFAKLEARCRPDAIFCTNSSVMSLLAVSCLLTMLS